MDTHTLGQITHPDAARAHGLAAELCYRHQIRATPVNALEVARHLHLQVQAMDFRHDIRDTILAVLDTDANTLYYNVHADTPNLNAAMARLIGQHLLYPYDTHTTQHAVWRTPSTPPTQQDHVLTTFASSLLIHQHTLELFRHNGMDVPALARAFCVPPALISHAMER